MINLVRAGRTSEELSRDFEPSAASIAGWVRRAYAEDGTRPDVITAAQIVAGSGLARSTIARWLASAGLGRLSALDPPPPVQRYQRERPGELIHLDIKKLGRFDRPGHRRTGTRTGCRNRGAGWDFVHVAVDDATRLAYVEVLPDERKESATAFLTRALAWFAARGIEVERVMTDNGSGYRSRMFAGVLHAHAIRHIRTKPYDRETSGERLTRSAR